jgi:hypothetical protein
LKVVEILTPGIRCFTPRKFWGASKARRYRTQAVLLFSIILVIISSEKTHTIYGWDESETMKN